MRILWVATKPPVPAVDGGRLVALTTVRALVAAGHDVTVIAPVAPEATADTARAAAAAGLGTLELVPLRPRPWPLAALVAGLRGLPVAIARHDRGALRTHVERALAGGGWDVVHAEQVQAMPACAAAPARGVPVVVRAHNVESEVWSARGSAPVRFEARRLARFEGAAVRRAAAAVALTARDAERLTALADGRTRVHHVAAPFPLATPGAGPMLAGTPAVTLPASRGWPPNDEGSAWFLRAVWPAVAAALPAARLHVFGAAPAGTIREHPTIVRHAAPAESAALFPGGAIVVVPLLTAAGVRMRILEAWARGLPVVATPAAVAGLDDAVAAHALLLAGTADEMTHAIAALAADAELRRTTVAAGVAYLRAHHDPATVGRALADVYRSVASAARART